MKMLSVKRSRHIPSGELIGIKLQIEGILFGGKPSLTHRVSDGVFRKAYASKSKDIKGDTYALM